MNLGYITNSLVIAAGMMCVAFGYVYRRDHGQNSIRAIIFLLGLFIAVWNGFAGMLGFAATPVTQESFHRIYLVGLVAYLVTEYYLIARLVRLPKRTFIVTYGSELALGILDAYLYGHFSDYEYLTVHGRTCFTMTPNISWGYHVIYCLLLIAFYGYLTLQYAKKLEFRREQRLAQMVFWSNFFVLLSAIPDTILPVFGIPSFPASGLGAVISYIVTCRLFTNYNAYSISFGNLGEYVFDSAKTGILVFDTSGRLMNINRYAQELLQVDKHTGCGVEELFAMTGEQREELLGEAQDVRLTSLDGSRTLSVSTSKACDANGDPYCMILTIYDLTNEEHMMQEVIKANRAKSSFLANMSHEVRTPINAILGMNEMIIRESKDRQITEYAADIESAGRSLLAIVNDILDFSKIENGNMEILPVNYDLQSLLTDSYNMILLRALKKGLKVRLDCDPDTPTALRGDEVRIRQIITNLLTNAVKYTEEGTITLRVRYELLEEDRLKLIITVEDTGIGIREEDLSDLFVSFKRIDEKMHRNIEGTGLGLPVTKMLLELMEGTIDVKSEFGVGSAFTVTIPQRIKGSERVGSMSQRYAVSQKQEDKPEETAPKALFAPQARVLAVDDVPMNLKVLSGLLKRTGIQVDKATSGIECLALVKFNHYDMIFMDHMMPEMDGVETFKRIRDMEGHPNVNTPVIMLTANAVVGAEEEYLAEGFDDYLSKPLKPAALESLLWKYLPRNVLES